MRSPTPAWLRGHKVRLELAPKASRDLADLLDDLAERAGVGTAQRWRELLRSKIALIGRQPLVYALRQDLGEGRRAAVVRPYVIVFRADADRVLVIRVLHAARDLPQALADPTGS